MRRHVYYYTHVLRDFGLIAPLVAGDPGAWLPPPAEPDGEGWLIDLRADGIVPGRLASQPATAQVGPARSAEGTLVRPVLWHSAATPTLFPVLDGELELTALNQDLCQLTLLGSYRPPLAVVGALADRAAGHRVAEAVVRQFVLDVADRCLAVALTG